MSDDWLDRGHGADGSRLATVFGRAPSDSSEVDGAGAGSHSAWLAAPVSLAIVALVVVVGSAGAVYARSARACSRTSAPRPPHRCGGALLRPLNPNPPRQPCRGRLRPRRRPPRPPPRRQSSGPSPLGPTRPSNAGMIPRIPARPTRVRGPATQGRGPATQGRVRTTRVRPTRVRGPATQGRVRTTRVRPTRVRGPATQGRVRTTRVRATRVRGPATQVRVRAARGPVWVTWVRTTQGTEVAARIVGSFMCGFLSVAVYRPTAQGLSRAGRGARSPRARLGSGR